MKKIREFFKLLFRLYYQKSYSQFGEDILIDHALDCCGVQSVYYMDIGANHPFSLSNTYRFYKKGFKGVLVEPNPKAGQLLRFFRKRDKLLQIGIGTTSGNLDYYQLQPNTLNTFSEQTAKECEQIGLAKILGVEKIPVKTIQETIDKECERVPNFISLDIEGLDFDILQSYDFQRHRAEVFCVETRDIQDGIFVENTALIEFMQQKDYVIFASTHLNTIFVDKHKLKIQ